MERNDRGSQEGRIYNLGVSKEGKSLYENITISDITSKCVMNHIVCLF